MWTQNDEQETLSSTEQEEEEKAIYSSYLFDQFQIKQDIPQDSEGSEHGDKETDNQDNSGEIIQENHHHEPEGTLQETPEEFVQGTSTLAFTAHVMHPGNQEEMSKETVP